MIHFCKDCGDISSGGLAQYGSSDGSGSGTVQKDDEPYVDNYCSTEAADRIYTQKLKLQENCPVPMVGEQVSLQACFTRYNSRYRHITH